MFDLALTFGDMGSWEPARDLHEQTFTSRRRVLGDDHPHTLSSLRQLADALTSVGRQDKAETLLENFANTKTISRTWVDNMTDVTSIGIDHYADVRLEVKPM